MIWCPSAINQDVHLTRLGLHASACLSRIGPKKVKAHKELQKNILSTVTLWRHLYKEIKHKCCIFKRKRLKLLLSPRAHARQSFGVEDSIGQWSRQGVGLATIWSWVASLGLMWRHDKCCDFASLSPSLNHHLAVFLINELKPPSNYHIGEGSHFSQSPAVSSSAWRPQNKAGEI